MFGFTFHTAFVNSNRLVLRRIELDEAANDVDERRFFADFRVEITFRQYKVIC
jgi:hypothetical protein